MILEVKDIKKIYGKGEASVAALDGVSFDVKEGEFVAVMGPSGSGKSTLLNVLGGLDGPTSGEVLLEGERISGKQEEELVDIRRGKLAYVFQQYHLLPSLTALENVTLPMTFVSLNGESYDKAYNILAKVGLAKRAHHRPSELSGGEQQRVSIARALANDPALILADEPTGNLDSRTGEEILEVFKELNKEGRTIVMVTHDAEKAKVASRVLYLEDGKIVKEEKR